MLSFRQPLSVEQRRAFDAGSLNVKTCKFAGFHVFKGGNTIVKLAEAIKTDLSVVQSCFAHVPDQPCDFSCPQGHLRSAHSQFDCHNISKSIWCSSCRGCHAAPAYKCPCGTGWHKCLIHFAVPSSSTAAATRAAPRGTKRPAPVAASVSQATLRWLEPSIASRVILTPGLAARFPHLVSGRNEHTHMANQDTPGDRTRTQSPNT